MARPKPYELLLEAYRQTAKHRQWAEQAEQRTLGYLKKHPKLLAEYQAFNRAGGGSVEDLQRWLQRAVAQQQKKHLALVVSNDENRTAV